MQYRILFKKLMEATQQIVAAEEVFEADDVGVVEQALVLYRNIEDELTVTRVFPPTWWMNVEPADASDVVSERRSALVQP